MAKYGTSRYSSGFRYGETSAVGVYYNSGIEAWSYNYNEVAISWGVSKRPSIQGRALDPWRKLLLLSHIAQKIGFALRPPWLPCL